MSGSMATPRTSRSLLERLQEDPSNADWTRLVDLYGPVIYSWARRQSLQPQDASDLMQDVLAALPNAITKWDPRKGPFRGWLWTLTRNKARDFWRAESRRERAVGEPAVRELLADIEERDGRAQRQWEDCYDTELLDRAMEALRPEFTERAWRAFHMLGVEGRSTRYVSEKLGTTLNAVRIAKSRVLARLREDMAGLIDL